MKTFRVTQTQIVALRQLMVDNGHAEELEKLTNCDIAFRWKVLNIEGFYPQRYDQYANRYHYMLGFDLKQFDTKNQSASNEHLEVLVSNILQTGAIKLNVSDQAKSVAFIFEKGDKRWTIGSSGKIYANGRPVPTDTATPEAALEYLIEEFSKPATV